MSYSIRRIDTMDYSELKYENVDFESDQDKKLPQPPLVKERMREESIDLK